MVRFAISSTAHDSIKKPAGAGWSLYRLKDELVFLLVALRPGDDLLGPIHWLRPARFAFGRCRRQANGLGEVRQARHAFPHGLRVPARAGGHI